MPMHAHTSSGHLLLHDSPHFTPLGGGGGVPNADACMIYFGGRGFSVVARVQATVRSLWRASKRQFDREPTFGVSCWQDSSVHTTQPGRWCANDDECLFLGPPMSPTGPVSISAGRSSVLTARVSPRDPGTDIVKQNFWPCLVGTFHATLGTPHHTTRWWCCANMSAESALLPPL
jgi:hypothetical protein